MVDLVGSSSGISGDLVDLSDVISFDVVSFVVSFVFVVLVVSPPIPDSGRHGQRGQSVSDRDNNVGIHQRFELFLILANLLWLEVLLVGLKEL